MELPRGWKSTTLGEVCAPRRAGIDPRSRGDAPFVGLEHVEAQTTRLLGHATGADVRSTCYEFRRGDTLYGRLRPYLNKVHWAEFDGLASGEFIIFPPSPWLAPRFLMWLLNQSRFLAFVSTLDTGDRPRVRWEQLKSFRFGLPPYAEQERIVAVIEEALSRLDSAAAAVSAAGDRSRLFKQSVLRSAVTGRLSAHQGSVGDWTRGNDLNSRRAGRLWGSGTVPTLTQDERATVPDHWRWTTVRHLGTDPQVTVQVGPMSMRSADFSNVGVPVLNVGSIQWDRIDESKVNYLPASRARAFERYRIRPGDVLFTRSGTVGRAAVASDHHDGWLMTFHLLRVRPSRDRIRPAYLRMVFEGAPHIRRQTAAAAIGTTRAGFNTNLLAELDVAVPPIAEQDEIVETVAALSTRVSALTQSISRTKREGAALKTAILASALTGTLRVSTNL